MTQCDFTLLATLHAFGGSKWRPPYYWDEVGLSWSLTCHVGKVKGAYLAGL